MLRIWVNKSAQGLKNYHTQSLQRDDSYYHEGLEVAGTWGGKTAAMLRLEGEIHQSDFFALCDNLNPETREQLTPRNKDNRRVAYDFTFSAPKAVSVLYELSGDERILQAFRDSVRETMEEAESEMQTRNRKGGKDEDRLTGNMVWGEYLHFTNRPSHETEFGFEELYAGSEEAKRAAAAMAGFSDPHLHAHCVAFNVTYDVVEKRFKAGQFGDLKRDGYYYEDAFHTRFAKRLNALNYATERKGNSFTLAQAPQSLTDKFSRRRNEIEKDAREKGISDAEGKHEIARKGRQKKTKAKSRSELRELWDSVLSPEERAYLSDMVHGDGKQAESKSVEEAREYALEHIFERHSTVPEKRVLAEMLSYGVGSVQPEAAKAALEGYKDLIRVKQDGQMKVTTKTVLRDEVAMLQFAKDGQRKFRPFLTKLDPAAVAGLSEEKKKAALDVLTSRDQVVGIRGGAGTGKTHLLQTLNTIISSIESRSAEYSKIFAFAQSTTASRGELRRVGYKEAETLAMLFGNKELQAKLRNQVLLMDESSLVSSKDMLRTFEIAREQNARVIVVGDYRQNSSVEAGDAFRVLESEGGVKYAELNEIQRQTHLEYKKAVEQISGGTAKGGQAGFDKLDHLGWIVEAQGEERHRLLVADYLKATEDGKSALIIAPTHAEGRGLTDELRQALKARGAIGKEREAITWRSAGWTNAQKGDIRNYEPGMTVEFHQNAKGFTRGDKAVVAHGENGLYLQGQDGTKSDLPLNQAERFEVYRTREIGISKGDRIRITKNGEAKVEGQTKGTRINNGDIYTVHGFTKEGDIRLDNGKLLPKNWGHVSLGYVDTSYASQGKTVGRVFIAVGNQSLPAANQQQWYVSASRGREMAKVYVEDKQEVRDAIARTGQRLSAVELTGTKLRPSWRSRFYESLERGKKYFKQRTESIADYLRDKGRGKESVTYA